MNPETLRKNGLLVVALLIFIAGWLIDRRHTALNDLSFLAEQTETQLGTAHDEFNELVNNLRSAGNLNHHGVSITTWNDLKKKPFELLVFQNDSLKFWTSNAQLPFNTITGWPDGEHFAELRNGDAVTFKKSFNDGLSSQTWVGLVSLQHKFSIENEYLKSQLNPDLLVPANIEVSRAPLEQGYVVKSSSGDPLFYLLASEEKRSADPNYFSFIIQMLALLVLFVYLHRLALTVSNRFGPAWGFLGLVLLVLGIRYLTILFGYPDEKINISFFDPQYFASSVYNNSLGDLLINVLLTLWLVWVFARRTAFHFSKSLSSNLRWLLVLAGTLVLTLLPRLILSMFQSLVIDSQISFDVNNFLSLDRYSFIGLLSLGLILLAYFIFSQKIIQLLDELELPFKQKLIALFGTLVLAGVFFFTFYDATVLNVISLAWTALYIVMLSRMVKRQLDLTVFTNLITILFLFTLFSAASLYYFNTQRENENRKVFAHQLAKEREAITEYLFQDIQGKLFTDPLIKQYFINPYIPYQAIADRLRYYYFSGYFTKYELRFITLDKERIIFKSKDPFYEEYINDDLMQYAHETSSDFLFYISKPSGSYAYIANLPIMDEGRDIGVLIVELAPKIFSGGNVYPELLLEERIKPLEEFEKYDYSVYVRGNLISQKGDQLHSMAANLPGEFEEYDFFSEGGFSHLVYRPAADKKVVVSLKKSNWLEPLSLFSYLFCLFYVFIAAVAVIRIGVKTAANRDYLDEIFDLSLRSRIQYSMLFIIFLPLAIIGGVTIKHFTDQYDSYHKSRLIRKEKAVLSATEYLVQESEELRKSGRNINRILKGLLSNEIGALSDIHRMDINIYDLQGDLILSSQPGIFDKGLISRKINPEAWFNLLHFDQPQVILNEAIGTLNYLSIYVPVKNDDAETIAYLNLPYFAKEKNLKKEISLFLVTLINVYVLLLVCGGLIAFLLSNSITRSLSVISRKLRAVQLGKTNEPIEWNSNDEVGMLVAEYNKMINELESSAHKLAKSERESAWREMAKQIAHEIKNPLTPMKLNIQQLQRMMEDKRPDMEVHVKRVTKTLIEQIDNLAQIATAFSSFAQMPRANNEVFNLKDTIANVVTLFQEEETVEIVFDMPEFEYMVYADRNQVMRAFNNLIKNGVQAIPDEKEGVIRVAIERKKGTFLVSVADNGEGISDDKRKSVFVPNFTTKGSGMGLGLAITRQIIETAHGDIWFESEVDVGTTFFVELPEYRE